LVPLVTWLVSQFTAANSKILILIPSLITNAVTHANLSSRTETNKRFSHGHYDLTAEFSFHSLIINHTMSRILALFFFLFFALSSNFLFVVIISAIFFNRIHTPSHTFYDGLQWVVKSSKSP
jgi:hypothetical protein